VSTEPNTFGKVILHTTLGPLDVELWPKEAPKAVRNFVQLCLEHYYDGCIFHRLIKDFIVQTGDASGTGDGGESIYGEEFAREVHSRLRFSHRGILAMAGGADGNLSQFFITLDKAPQLDRKHTIFGKLTGNAIYNLLPVNDLPVGDNERPLFPPKILRTEVLACPFDDIVPRVRARPVAVDAAAEQATSTNSAAKRVTNRNVLSFVEEDGDDDDDDGEAVPAAALKLVPVHAKPTPMMVEAQAKRRRVAAEPKPAEDSTSSSDSSGSGSGGSSEPAATGGVALQLAEQERKLLAEIRAARIGAEATAAAAATAKKAKAEERPSVRLEGAYDISAMRAKFAQAAKGDRESAALAKLSGFAQKIRAAVDPEEIQSKAAANTADAAADDEDDDPRALFSHSLVFEKRAKHIDDEDMARGDDQFEVTDSRDRKSALALADPLAALDDRHLSFDEKKRRDAIRSGGHAHTNKRSRK
jgi:peptidyl-prolyl cis-trans isomerase SDCCAG10